MAIDAITAKVITGVGTATTGAATPAAGAESSGEGFVSLPNVDQPQEMVDMLGAARAYQANLAAIGMIRDLIAKSLELGRS